MVNPLGSQDPQDFKTNVGNLDKAVNQTSSDKWNDRFGVERFTWRGLENKVDAALARIAFNVPVDYAQGLLVNSNGFTVEYEGVVYAPQPSNVPFTTGAWDADMWYPIQNVFTQNNLLVFDDYASAEAAAATLPDGQVVDVAETNTRYDATSGSLVNARPITPLSVVTGVVRSVQEKLGQEFVSIKDFGAIGDGALHPLSEKFSTLAAAQVAYPHATSLSQSIDWAALVSAMRSGADWVYAPKGHYMLNDTVPKADGVMVVGDGNDLWMPGVMDFQGWRLSDDHGTHFYFCGTGPKSYTINNLSNTSPSRTNEGTTYDLIDFTLRDSVAGAPATPKPFSVAWIVGRNSGIQNCRIIPSNNKLAGYLDRSVTTLSDDWDIGVWLLHPQDSYCFNVQSVGHWRMGAWLQTENDSGTATWTTSERANIEKCMGNGVRGLLIRHHPAYWVTANTADTVTVKWNPTFTLTRFPQARINGVISTYTGYTFNSVDNTVTLTGVSPAIVGNITGTPVRSAYSGNNLSNTVYKDCVFSTIDHNTYQPSEALGLPVSFAGEYDGWPLRNVVHINTVFQTRYDKGNTIWGHCQDFKYIGCKHENGALIAFDVAEAGPLHANNMRFIAEDSIWYDTHLWGFKPRSAIVDSYQNNQQGTDGSFYQRPLPGKRLVLQNQASQEVLTTSATDGLVTLWNGAHTARIELPDDGVGRIRMDTLRFLNAAGTETGRITGTGTPTFELKGNVISTGYVRPSTDNVSPCGGGSNRWSVVFAGTGTINTSDAREKTEALQIDDAVLDAWADVQWIVFQWLDAIEKKGEDGARWHFGVIAQQVRDAFAAHGLDGTRYGLLCYDEWGDEYAPVIGMRDVEREVVEIVGFEDDGTPIERARTMVDQEEYDTGEVQLVRAAGNRWGIRADQCLFLEAAYQRRRADRIEARLDAAGI